MELLNIEEKHRMSREDAAAVLRDLADSLARHNSVEFLRGELKFTVDVANQVDVEIELEIEDDGGSLEIELNW